VKDHQGQCADQHQDAEPEGTPHFNACEWVGAAVVRPEITQASLLAGV